MISFQESVAGNHNSFSVKAFRLPEKAILLHFTAMPTQNNSRVEASSFCSRPLHALCKAAERFVHSLCTDGAKALNQTECGAYMMKGDGKKK